MSNRVELHECSAACPLAGAEPNAADSGIGRRAFLTRGAIVDATSTGFTCPRHGAQFSTTGEWTGGRSTPNLVSYPVQYRATKGTLTISV